MTLSKNTDYPIEIRKKISKNILRMRTDITCAINFRKLEDKPLNEKIAGNYNFAKCKIKILILLYFYKFLSDCFIKIFRINLICILL